MTAGLLSRSHHDTGSHGQITSSVTCVHATSGVGTTSSRPPQGAKQRRKASDSKTKSTIQSVASSTPDAARTEGSPSSRLALGRPHDAAPACPGCFPWCSRFGPRCAPGCYTARRELQRFALFCTERAEESRESIGLGDRRKPRRGLEIGPEEKTPQAVRACGVWGYGKRLATITAHNGRMSVARPIGSSAPGGTRTPNPRFRRPMLYPVELRAHGIGKM